MRIVASAFDSDVYGLRIGRVDVGLDTDIDEQVERVSADYDLLVLRLDDANPLNAELARRGQFPVDTLVTSRLDPATHTGSPAVVVEHLERIEDERDIRSVVEITAESIVRSHFHADRRLPADRTRDLYARWARNDVTGRARHVILVREQRDVIGYIAVTGTANTAVIDLVAVSARARGKGLGSALLAGFIGWVRDQGLAATVGTQSDNPALKLYQRHGFTPYVTHHTYHLWSR